MKLYLKCFYILDQHLLVYAADLFTHVLDLGIAHEPCCHFIIDSPSITNSFLNLVPLPGTTTEVLDLKTFDILKLSLTRKKLIDSFNYKYASLNNKLSILHYILVHLNDMEFINEVCNLFYYLLILLYYFLSIFFIEVGFSNRRKINRHK